MKTLKISFLALFAAMFLTACETPPPGTVVFDGKGDPDETVMEYLGITDDQLEGYNVIKIETQSIRNPQDSTAVYQPAYGTYANFQ